MLAILFDFPWEDRRKLTYWSDWAGDLQAALDPEPARSACRSSGSAPAISRNWKQRQAAELRPDLISRMIHSEATRDMTRRNISAT